MKTVASTKTHDFYANADLRKYAGEWVAIIEDKVVAHGKSAKEILQDAKKIHPKAIPFIVKVPVKKTLLW